MTAANREPSILVTLGYEGGYTNDKADPGGPTNWGITIHDARAYWKSGATAADVKAMPRAVAVEIYRSKYWAPARCDGRPDGVDLVTFDYVVNSGLGKTAICDSLHRDDPVAWVKAICSQRLNFLQHLRTWSVFGRGWGARVANVEARGVRMALSAQHPPEVVKKKLEEHSETHRAHAHRRFGLAALLVPLVAFAHAHPVLMALGALVAVPLLTLLVWEGIHHFHREKAYANA